MFQRHPAIAWCIPRLSKKASLGFCRFLPVLVAAFGGLLAWKGAFGRVAKQKMRRKSLSASFCRFLPVLVGCFWRAAGLSEAAGKYNFTNLQDTKPCSQRKQKKSLESRVSLSSLRMYSFPGISWIPRVSAEFSGFP